jgi:hypothetical protein
VDSPSLLDSIVTFSAAGLTAPPPFQKPKAGEEQE